MMLEAQTIAENLGVKFPIDVERRIDGGAAVGAHRTSMLQDLDQGRPMEIDALVASVQEADRFVVYDRLPPHAPRGIFSVVKSSDGAIDAVSHTDGLDVVSAALPGYPGGLLVVQDDGNPQSGVDQNFKLVDWSDIVNALDLTE